MGVCATAIFDIRNMDKVGHGDTGRVGAVAAQTTNLVNAASRSSIEPVQKAASTALNYIDDAGNVVGVTNAASKVTGLASKAVNPLLCVASGVRVLKDDDQYAALIEEGCAMGAMFAGEKLLKTLVANPIAKKEVKTTSKWATKIVPDRIKSRRYSREFKKMIVRLHKEEGWTFTKITEEYGVSKATITKWCSDARYENTAILQEKTKALKDTQQEYEKVRQENIFLKRIVIMMLGYEMEVQK